MQFLVELRRMSAAVVVRHPSAPSVSKAPSFVVVPQQPTVCCCYSYDPYGQLLEHVKQLRAQHARELEVCYNELAALTHTLEQYAVTGVQVPRELFFRETVLRNLIVGHETRLSELSPTKN